MNMDKLLSSNLHDFSDKSIMPDVPEEFIGNEPSLEDLTKFVQQNPEKGLERHNLLIGLETYLANTKDKWTNGKYYLLGQLILSPNERLSNEILKKAVEIDDKRSKEYGDPYNQAEYWSIQRHHNCFTSIKNLITLYYLVEEM